MASYMGVQNFAFTGIRSPDCPAWGKLLYQLHYPSPQRSIYKMFNSLAVWYCFTYATVDLMNLTSTVRMFFIHTPSHIHEHPHMWFNVTLYEKEETLIIQGTDALSLPSIPTPLFTSFTVVHYRIQIRIECGHNKQLRRNINTQVPTW